MHIKLKWTMVLSFLPLFSIAGTLELLERNHFKAVATLFTGPAWTNNSNSSNYTVADDERFTYSPQTSSSPTSLLGFFLGLEHLLHYTNLFIQLGFEYDHYNPTRINGMSLAGVQVNTATTYTYQYQLHTQQVMATAKLFKAYPSMILSQRHISPYVSMGLGTAFNQASQFFTYTTQSGEINLTPTFSSGSKHGFSYNLGIGIEIDVGEYLRAGIGYRYSNFGNVSLGNGVVAFNSYASSAGFNLGMSNTYANQILLQLTYVI